MRDPERPPAGGTSLGVRVLTWVVAPFVISWLLAKATWRAATRTARAVASALRALGHAVRQVLERVRGSLARLLARAVLLLKAMAFQMVRPLRWAGHLLRRSLARAVLLLKGWARAVASALRALGHAVRQVLERVRKVVLPPIRWLARETTRLVSRLWSRAVVLALLAVVIVAALARRGWLIVRAIWRRAEALGGIALDVTSSLVRLVAHTWAHGRDLIVSVLRRTMGWALRLVRRAWPYVAGAVRRAWRYVAGAVHSCREAVAMLVRRWLKPALARARATIRLAATIVLGALLVGPYRVIRVAVSRARDIIRRRISALRSALAAFSGSLLAATRRAYRGARQSASLVRVSLSSAARRARESITQAVQRLGWPTWRARGGKVDTVHSVKAAPLGLRSSLKEDPPRVSGSASASTEATGSGVRRSRSDTRPPDSA